MSGIIYSGGTANGNRNTAKKIHRRAPKQSDQRTGAETLPNAWIGAFSAEYRALPSEGIRAGELIGYRAWGLSLNDTRLRSWFAPWQWNSATFEAGEQHVQLGLGIFAFKTMSQARDGIFSLLDGVVFGSVELWGDVVEHTGGYRAQFAKIKSIDEVNMTFYLWPFSFFKRRTLLRKLRAFYGVTAEQA